MTWHDKRLLYLVSVSDRLSLAMMENLSICRESDECFMMFHACFILIHHISLWFPPFFSVWQMKQKALFIPSQYLQDSNFLTFFLTQSTRFIKASMVEITLPSSKLRNCAEAGRSIAEETSTKERHCLRERWVETTNQNGFAWDF